MASRSDPSRPVGGRAAPPPHAARPVAPITPGARRSRPSVPAPESRTIDLGGRAMPYLLKVSTRARRVRLVVRPEGSLEVVIPRGVARAAYEAVLRDKARWIFATLERVAREQVAPPPLATGQRLALADQTLTLVLRVDASQSRPRAALREEMLLLILPHDDASYARKVLEAWYRRQAHAIFEDRLALANNAYGYLYGRVSVKSQKSRWGSCSRLGNLNFNWRLLLAPLEVLDYVVIHELCHLKEMNHGARFWQLVARACPDYAAHRRWLRQHGRELTF